MKKRILSILLVALMVVALLPTTALAEGTFDTDIYPLMDGNIYTNDTCYFKIIYQSDDSNYSLNFCTSYDGSYSKFNSPTTTQFTKSGDDYNYTLGNITFQFVKSGSDVTVTVSGFFGNNEVRNGNYTVYTPPHSHKDADGNDVTFKPWTSNNSLPAAADLTGGVGSYYLDTDVTLSDTWTVPTGITNLDLNGHVIKADTSSSNFGVIKVPATATLNLYDCGTTEHRFTVDSTTGLWTLNEEATGDYKTVTGGVITGGNAGSSGGAVYVSGTFNMYGGSITGNQAYYGGGIQSESSATLNLLASAGKTITIIGNTATSTEGGIANWGTMHLSGKVIIKDNICTNKYDGTNYPVNLATKSPVVIDGALTNSEIYITHANSSNDKHDTGVLTSGFTTQNPGAKLGDFFTYDGPNSFVMVLNADGANAGELEIITAPKGTEANPWKIGKTDAAEVTAYIKDGTLYVNGTGAGEMKDFESNEAVPWYASKDSFNSVLINSGVKSISGKMLQDYDNVLRMYVNAWPIPTLAADAFSGCDNLKIYVPKADIDTYKTAGGWSSYAAKFIELLSGFGDILATADGGFPTSSDDNAPANAWVNASGAKLYLKSDGGLWDLGLPSNSTVNFDIASGNYVWASSGTTITFVMHADKLTGVTASGFYPEELNGEYSPVQMVTVTFDMKGHGTTPDPVTVAAGSTITGPVITMPAGYEFIGWYKDSACTTGNEFDFETPITANITLYAKWLENPVTPPSSGDGGSSSSTITVPVSGDENSVQISATVSGSTATVKPIKDAELAKVADGESVAIDLSGAGKNVDTAKIPTETVEKIAEKSALTVKLPVATVEFDKAATEEIADQAKGSNIELVVDSVKEVSLNAVQKEAVKKLDTAIIIDAHLASNGSKLCTADNGGFGSGKATVILPYEIKNNRTAANYSVYYVDDAGKLEKLSATYDTKLAAFVFEIEHFSVYAVAYDEYVMPFVDVPETAYYYDAVKWAAANAITSGTDATHFNPLGITSRAQMVTFLWRAAGEPEPAVTSCKFTDVKANAYYYKAVLWAVEKGITDGTSETTFSPDMNVSRAQAVTFLARMSGVKDDATGYTHKFTDVKATAYYNNAVAWAYENKITDGTSETTFSPNDDCLRNQIVCFLYRNFVK